MVNSIVTGSTKDNMTSVVSDKIADLTLYLVQGNYFKKGSNR